MSEAPTEQVEEKSSQSPTEGEVRFVSRDRLMLFNHPRRVYTAHTVEEIPATLESVDKEIRSGYWAAGYVAYEAAAAFDDALKTHAPSDEPLVWFAIYNPPKESMPRNPSTNPFTIGEWTPQVDRETYTQAIEKIRALIGDGESYQVNYTFPMTAPFEGDALNWFRVLCTAQHADHCAFVDTGAYQILSASPELFFKLEDGVITTKPMKGTRPRGLWPAADEAARAALADSEKERAENIMIVDLLRNDLGKICDPGTIETPALHETERYETVWQMTSTVTGKTQAPVHEILKALFPSGSVTGAPKVRTMGIINDLEPHPRGVYCGAIGWISPDHRAEFNVAIRTATINREAGQARYHVGGGITWDSTADAEYEECCSKAAILNHRPAEFSLFESLRYDGEEFYLLDRHLQRLAASASHFGFPFNADRIRQDLLERVKSWTVSSMHPLKVRVILARTGGITIEAHEAAPATAIRLGFARDAVDRNDPNLYHKTTHRNFYETARCTRPDCDDVLLWNDRNEITESTWANVVLQIDGERLTPPVESGLLAGTMRQELLDNGMVREATLQKSDVERAEHIWLINSVRRWVPTIWRS